MTQFKNIHTHSLIKKTALCTLAGSMTIEAAFAVPIFLFASICLIYLLEIHAIQTTVRMAAHAAAKQTAEQLAVAPELGCVLFRSYLLRAAGSGRLDRSIIRGGSSGIQCGDTKVNSLGQVEVCVEYSLELPFPDFAVPGLKCKEAFKVKGWTGYERSGVASADGSDAEIVYVTDQGAVYHTDYQCSHLQLSIRFVADSNLESLRNEGGGRYHACERCTSLPGMGGYYITDYGDKYHSSLRCGGLKRTIYTVTKAEAEGIGGCSKCSH